MASSSLIDFNLFSSLVERLLNNWTAFMLVIENNAGGQHTKEKAIWFIDVICDYFHKNADLHWSEVEEYMNSILYEEFDTILEDNSLEPIAKSLCDHFVLLKNGNIDEFQRRLNSLPTKASLEKCVQANKDDSDSDESMIENDDEIPYSKGDNSITSNHTSSMSSPSNSTAEHMDTEQDDEWTVIEKRKKKKNFKT